MAILKNEVYSQNMGKGLYLTSSARCQLMTSQIILKVIICY